MSQTARPPLSIVRTGMSTNVHQCTLPALQPSFPTFRLTFMLPPVLGLLAPGLQPPASDGCQLRIARAGLVHVTGGSRRQVFDHAAKFLRKVAKGRGAIAFTAVVDSPPGYWAGSSGRDFWSIVVGADVSFAPTGLGAEVFPTDEEGDVNART